MSAETELRKGAGIAEIAAGAVVLVVAFFLTTQAGRRGFYPFDQSIVFDGSYRVLSGQIPYRDFLVPFGPVTFWLHALFFKALGTNYQAYITGAGIMNALAAMLAMLTVKMLFPRVRFLPLIAGILTAVWFYPPFGTPWVDQTAFFLSLLAIALAVKSLSSGQSSLKCRLLMAGAGCCAVLSFLSKQNAGSFMVFVFPLMISASRWGRPKLILEDIGFLALGAVSTGAAFSIWLVAASDVWAFSRYFFEIPAALGRERLLALFRTGFGILRPFFGGRGPVLLVAALLVSLVVGVSAIVLSMVGSGRYVLSRQHRLAAVICIYLLAFQHVFINTTLNQPENGLGFTGLIVAVAAGLLFSSRPLGSRETRIAVVLGLAVFVFFAARTGYGVAMRRDVHEMFRGTKFGASLPVKGLRSIRWAQPTRIRGFEVRPAHLVLLCDYLRERDENFFVFPDFTVLYGIVGTPSPQPLLWFHEGVTYSKDNNSDLDEHIVASLKGHKVEILIREQVAWFSPGERLDDFPQVKAFIKSEFKKVGHIGIFSVYEKR